MTTQQKEEEHQPGSRTTAVGLRGMVEQYHKIKENAETYPYVWASYIVVYGGFALWGAYRVRKLFKTEDRVRALQERLRKIVETEESASTATSVEKAPPAPDKTSK